MLGIIFFGIELYWIFLWFYICLGLFILLIMVILFVDFVMCLFGVINMCFGFFVLKLCYVRFYVIGIIIILFMLVLVVLYNGFKELLVKNIKLFVKNFFLELNGFMIVYFFDLYVGFIVGKIMLEKVV